MTGANTEVGGAICYTLTEYPGISNTFIRQEIIALRERGVSIKAVPIRRSADSQVLSEADHRERDAADPVLPLGVNDLVSAVIKPALKHPGAFFKLIRLAIKTGGTDIKNIVWALFYVVEAMAVWNKCQTAGIHHIHAHFASVSSNLAWFATEFGNEIRRPSDPEWTWSFTMHGYHEFIEQKAHRLDLKIASASAVICIADYIKSQLMRLSDPQYWEKFTVVHCGIDVDKFAYVEPTKPDGPFRILHVGRLAEEKGQPLMVEAVGELRSRGHDVCLDIIGAGPLQSAIEETIERLGLQESVILHGAKGHDEIVDWYRSADAFCLPSFVEGVPIVLMEAMASGIPVVTTRITGIPELITENESGLLVTPGRGDLLADAIERLVSEDGLTQKLAVNARKTIEAEFDVDKTSPEVAEVLGQFVKDKQ